jgi:hypothetical protein
VAKAQADLSGVGLDQLEQERAEGEEMLALLREAQRLLMLNETFSDEQVGHAERIAAFLGRK